MHCEWRRGVRFGRVKRSICELRRDLLCPQFVCHLLVTVNRALAGIVIRALPVAHHLDSRIGQKGLT